MSIDDATPDEWDKVTKKLRKEKEDKEYGDDVDSPFHYNNSSIGSGDLDVVKTRIQTEFQRIGIGFVPI